MRNWKRLGLLAVLGLVMSWMVSCASTPQNTASSASGTQEVEFWTMQLQPQFTDYFNELIANFEAENPDLKVRWTDVPWGDMQSKILTAVSANTAPDVVNLNPDFAAQLAGRNAWLPLDDVISAEQRALYLPKIWEANQIDGQSFGIPWYLATSITVSNREILEEAGVAEPPRTFAELATVAEQVRSATGKYAFFMTVVPEDSAEVLQSMVQMGVDLIDEEGNAAFNTPAGRAAFQYWVDLYQNGLLPQEVVTQGHRRGIDLYQAGETALVSTGPQFLSTIATNAPSIAAVSDASPQITGDTGKKNVAVMNLVIPRSTDKPEAAVKFALYVANPENQLVFAKQANVLPSTSASLEDEHFKSVAADAEPADQARIVSASQMTEAEVLLPTISDIKELQKIIYTNLQSAMLGQQTVDEAIATAETAWNSR
jgi:putative chitobiose transport system substrate-binding protein